MTPCLRAALAVVCGAVAPLMAAAPAHGTTVVPMGARALVESSVGAVRGRVTRIESGADPVTGAIHTYVTIEPSERVFGDLPDGPLVLRELGGRAGGRAQWVFGSPDYRVGESVLVFLSRHPDGALRTTALALGKYRVHTAQGITRAVRRFGANVAVLDRQSGAIDEHPKSDVVDFAALLSGVRAALNAGVGPARGRVVSRPAELAQVALESHPSFVLFNPLVRWFEPDEGMPVGYVIDATGDATLGVIVSRLAVDQGLAVWTDVPEASIELRDVGDSTPAPFGGCPDENRVVFNDPFEELDPPKNCEGILGIGGVCEADETRVVNGKTFRRIISGKVTFNDGWGDCAMWTPCNFAEIATHELGHSVGINHSTVTSATMAARAHFDGRCAGLTDDDRAALAFLYPLVPTPSATPTATSPPTVTPSPTTTLTPSSTPSFSQTATITLTGTVTLTPTRTKTATRTLTPSRTPIPTRTLTASRTATSTRTGTATRTATATRTPTSSRTATASGTATASRTPTASGTPTSSPLPTHTPSPSPTATRSRTRTASPTASITRSATASVTASASATHTPSVSPTIAAPPSATPTPSPPPRPNDWLAALVDALRHLLSTLATR
jgi:hypothetical protein